MIVERAGRSEPPAQPDSADALRRAGVLGLEQGQLERARELLEQAARRQTGSAAIHNDLGIALASLGRLDEAVAAFRTAAANDPGHADACFNLGCALSQLDRPHEAMAAYERAVAADPGLDEARIDLARLYRRLGRAADAVATLEGATQAALDTAELQLDLARALGEAGHAEAAEKAARRCLALDPALAAAHTLLGGLLEQAGRLDEAIPCFERAVCLRPNLAETHFNLGAVRLARGEPRAALAALERSLSIEPGGTRSLALETIALREAGERDALRQLADFERFVRTVEVAAPGGYASVSELNQALAEHVLSHPTLSRDPASHATRGGSHSGNLLAEPKGPVAALEKAIERAVLDYVRSLPHDPGHPFIAAAPRRMGMEAWGVVLGAAGHQVPHIHPGAWLSGVYYVRVPQAVDDAASRREGWIVFGCSHPRYPTTGEPVETPFKPREGTMILFPAYFYHHTVPFESAETRISIAFDVYPEPG